MSNKTGRTTTASPASKRSARSLDATPHTIAITQVTQSLQGARYCGLDVDGILRRSGIPPALIGSSLSRITQPQYAALIRILRRVTRDELWGLCAHPLLPGSFARTCRLLIHCHTLREVLIEGFSFVRLLLRDFVPRFTVQSAIAMCSMVTQGPRDARLAYAERLFCFFSYGLMCWLVGRRIPLLEVVYPPSELPYDTGDAHRMFEAPVRYADGFVSFRFDARWLDLPVVQNPQSLEKFLQRAPRGLLVKYRDRSSVIDRVRRELRRHPAGQKPTLQAMSATLAMSAKTLARRLQREGQQYQSLKDELRRDAAIDYLRNPSLTLLDISQRLGFSDSSAFHRAFKGWTGLAPGLYRQAVLTQQNLHRSGR